MPRKNNNLLLVGGALAIGAWVFLRDDGAAQKPSLPNGIATPPLPGACICVLGTLENQCGAIQDLLRPDEVRDVARYLLALNGDFVVHAGRHVAATIRYEPDPHNCDRWCSPARTLSTGRGDCDDFAILLASLLLAGGVDALVVIGRVDNNQHERHAWVEGRDARGTFCIEPQEGAVLLERPSRYAAEHFLGAGFCRPLANA